MIDNKIIANNWGLRSSQIEISQSGRVWYLNNNHDPAWKNWIAVYISTCCWNNKLFCDLDIWHVQVVFDIVRYTCIIIMYTINIIDSIPCSVKNLYTSLMKQTANF